MSQLDFKITVKMQGLEEFEKMVSQFTVREQRKILVPIFRKAARPTVQAMKSNAPVSNSGIVYEHNKRKHKSGTMKKSIRVTVAKKSPTIYVGPTPGGTNDAWYWLINSLGHRVSKSRISRSKKSGDQAKKMNAWTSGGGSVVPGNAYLQKSWERTQSSVLSTIKRDVSAYIIQRANGR